MCVYGAFTGARVRRDRQGDSPVDAPSIRDRNKTLILLCARVILKNVKCNTEGKIYESHSMIRTTSIN